MITHEAKIGEMLWLPLSIIGQQQESQNRQFDTKQVKHQVTRHTCFIKLISDSSNNCLLIIRGFFPPDCSDTDAKILKSEQGLADAASYMNATLSNMLLVLMIHSLPQTEGFTGCQQKKHGNCDLLVSHDGASCTLLVLAL